YLFLQQVLHGNTAVGHLRHLSGLDFTDSAYCQARQRLPVGFFQRLHQAVLAPCRRQASRWHGHRVYVLDGSSFSMPDTPGLRGLFRAHQKLIISFRPRRRHAGLGKVGPEQAGRPRSRWLKRLGKHDQLVEYFKPAQRPAWMTPEQYAALLDALTVRELRFK